MRENLKNVKPFKLNFSSKIQSKIQKYSKATYIRKILEIAFVS